MTRAYEFQNGEVARLVTSIKDLCRCTLTAYIYEGEELWMRFDTLMGHVMPHGTPLVAIFGPADTEDDGYRPIICSHTDVKYHMASLARMYRPKDNPYVKLGVISEWTVLLLKAQIESEDKAKQLQYERNQYERLKEKFEPEPKPKTFRIKAKFGRKVKAS